MLVSISEFSVLWLRLIVGPCGDGAGGKVGPFVEVPDDDPVVSESKDCIHECVRSGGVAVSGCRGGRG